MHKRGISRNTTIFLASILFLSTATYESFAGNSSTPKKGAACSKVGMRNTDSKGFEYQCMKVGKKLVWSAGHKIGGSPSPSPSASPSGSPSPSPSASPSPSGNGNQENNQTLYALGAFGTSCSNNGLIAWNGQITATCKGGKVSYTLASDVPPTPIGGYTSRPSWYPTLNQMFGQGTAEPTCAPSSIKFTQPILPLDQLAPSIPYGLTVGGHVTPIDHAYIGLKSLYLSDADRSKAEYVPITSPADGTIIEVGSLGSPDSHRVVISHGCNVYSVYMVVNRVTGVLASLASEVDSKGYIAANIKIKAGEEFGRQRDNMLDFNVFSGDTWLSGFQNIQSYLSAETWKPYTADFLPFFVPTIRTAMENQMQRTSAPRSGKIDYDVAGTASGNWFLAGTNGYSGLPNSIFRDATKMLDGSAPTGKNDGAWSHLSIAPHQVDQSAWVFSTGWWNDPKGDPLQTLLVVDLTQPAPDKLTASSGMVVYALSQLSFVDPPGSPAREQGTRAPFPIGYTLSTNGHRLGVVALQVNSDGSLSVEINSQMSSPNEFLAFTSAKRIYNR